jgi:hypothetical protein
LPANIGWCEVGNGWTWSELADVFSRAFSACSYSDQGNKEAEGKKWKGKEDWLNKYYTFQKRTGCAGGPNYSRL